MKTVSIFLTLTTLEKIELVEIRYCLEIKFQASDYKYHYAYSVQDFSNRYP